MENYPEIIGKRIRAARRLKSMSQQELADALQVNKSTIVRYEKGERVPDALFLARLSQITGVSTDWILKGEGQGPGIEDGVKETVYEKYLPPGLQELFNDKVTMRMMNITDEEVEMLKNSYDSTGRDLSKQGYIDLLFILRGHRLGE